MGRARFKIAVGPTVILLLGAWASGAEAQANRASGTHWSVDVTDVVPLGSSVSDGRQIHLIYRFAGRESVWLRGIGEVEPSGDLRFVIREDKLAFQSEKEGGVLASVGVEPTEFKQPPPHGTEYPPTAGRVGWLPCSCPPVTLQVDSKKAISILNRALYESSIQKYPASCGGDPEHELCWVTPWALIGRNQGLQAELSVLLTFADNHGQAPTRVEILVMTRQGYDGSSFEPGGAFADAKKDGFLKSLEDEISREGRPSQ